MRTMRKRSGISLIASGMLACAPLAGAGTTRYVDGSNTNSAPPYTDWLTAASTIQAAIDECLEGLGDEFYLPRSTVMSCLALQVRGPPAGPQ